MFMLRRARQSDAVRKLTVRFPRARNRETNLNFCSGRSYIAAASLWRYVATWRGVDTTRDINSDVSTRIRFPGERS